MKSAAWSRQRVDFLKGLRPYGQLLCPAPNFLRSFLLVQKLGAVYEIDPEKNAVVNVDHSRQLIDDDEFNILFESGVQRAGIGH